MHCSALRILVSASFIVWGTAGNAQTIEMLKSETVTAFNLGLFFMERDLEEFQARDNFYDRENVRNDIHYDTFVAYNPDSGIVTLGILGNRWPWSKNEWDISNDCETKIRNTRVWAGYDITSKSLIRDRSRLMQIFHDLVDGDHRDIAWDKDIAESTVIHYYGSIGDFKVECVGSLMSTSHEVIRP